MSTDPETLHCKADLMVCRGEDYCACQCEKCVAAWHAAPAFYADRQAPKPPPPCKHRMKPGQLVVASLQPVDPNKCTFCEQERIESERNELLAVLKVLVAAKNDDSVAVVYIADEYAKLCVNGHGIAQWELGEEVRGTGASGEEYAEEVARCLRIALRTTPSVTALEAAKAVLAKLKEGT